MTTTTRKYTSELKVGDIVRAHGGVFRIIEDARESQAHRPQAGHLIQAHGPSDCACAKSICIEGEFLHYFSPGSEWTFQGNFLAGQYTVAVSVEA